jgi:mannose-6-phosphate isomerase-like protein (cupin superfamily)
MISKHNAEHYVWGGDCDGWHLLKRNELSVIHERMPPGRTEVRHHHEFARQLFFVLSGKLTMVLADRNEVIGPGEAVEIPPGEVHRAENRGDGAVEFLVISHPTTRGDRIEAQG